MVDSDRSTLPAPGSFSAPDLTYSLSSSRDSGFEVVVRNRAGRRWLAEVTPTDDGDQRVVVYALVEAPAWLPDGDDYLVRPVADWVADSKHEPADIAGDVMRCCRVTSRRVA